MSKLFLEDLDVAGKRVLVRVDFNVPLDGDRNVADDTRIRAALPTINYIRERGGMAILMSHLGRPKGAPNDKYRMDAVAARLSELLGVKIVKTDDCVGSEVRKVAGPFHSCDTASRARPWRSRATHCAGIEAGADTGR